MRQVDILAKIVKEEGNDKFVFIINKVKNYVFDVEEYIQFFDIVYQYSSKYGKAPTVDYIESFIAMNPNKKGVASVFQEVMEADVVKEHIKSIIEQQVRYKIKNKMNIFLKEVGSSLEDTSIEQIDGVIKDTIENLLEFNKPISLENKNTIDIKDKATIIDEINNLESDNNRYFLSEFGIDVLDEFHSIKKNDFLMGILAPPKSYKSTITHFITYKQIIQGMNVLFVSLEMPAESIKQYMFLLHSNNTDIWGYSAPVIKNDSLRHKNFNEEEKNHYINAVKDFVENDRYGQLRIISPTNVYDFQQLKNDILETKLEMENNGKELHFVVIDYLTLVVPKTGRRTTVDDVNQMIRELRLFGLENGLHIITPVQANRNATNKNDKGNKDKLDINHIYQYSEIEKSFTIVLGVNIEQKMDNDSMGVAYLNTVISREDVGIREPIKIVVNPKTRWVYFGDDKFNMEEKEIIKTIESLDL